MVNLKYHWVEVGCPNCKYLASFQLIDAENAKLIYCHNCKASIQLKDLDASIHQSAKKLTDTLDNLLKTFKF